MSNFWKCVYISSLQFKREKQWRKNVIFLLAICFCFLFITITVNAINSENFVSKNNFLDYNSLLTILKQLFPNSINGSLGLFNSDVIIFYLSYMVISSCNILSDEFEKGIWIIPTCNGFTKRQLILSRSIVFSLGAALPCVFYEIIYYLIGQVYLKGQISVIDVVLHSVLLFIVVLSVELITFIVSFDLRSKTLSILTIIGCFIILPDILTTLNINIFFPTYLITNLITFSENYSLCLIPLIELIGITVVLCSKKSV